MRRRAKRGGGVVKHVGRNEEPADLPAPSEDLGMLIASTRRTVGAVRATLPTMSDDQLASVTAISRRLEAVIRAFEATTLVN